MFSFFHLFVLSSFSFCIVLRPVFHSPIWKTVRYPCLRKYRQETILSQHIYNLFTLSRAAWGILSMSMREAAIPNRQPTDLLFILYPPRFGEKSEKPSVPFHPWTGGFSRSSGGAGNVINLSKSVHKLFTLFRPACDII